MTLDDIPVKYPGDYLTSEETNLVIDRVKTVQDGTDGAMWLEGSGLPALSLGVIGDWYLDTDTGDAYNKDLVWGIPKINLKGVKGDTGDTGATGEKFTVDVVDIFANRSVYDGEAGGFNFLAYDTSDLYIKNSATSGDWSPAIPFGKGDKGATWHNGSGVPASGLGATEDYYINNDNKDYYEKTNTATWVLIGSFSGVDGSDGSDGVDGSSAYSYIAYADDSSGSGFTTTFSDTKNWIGIITSTTPLTPVVGDFAGLWRNYTGENVPRAYEEVGTGTNIDFGITKRTFRKTVNTTATLTFSNGFVGMFKLLRLVHTSTGTLSFPAGTLFANGTAPALTNVSGAVDEFVINYDGVNYIVHEIGLDIKA